MFDIRQSALSCLIICSSTQVALPIAHVKCEGCSHWYHCLRGSSNSLLHGGWQPRPETGDALTGKCCQLRAHCSSLSFHSEGSPLSVGLQALRLMPCTGLMQGLRWLLRQSAKLQPPLHMWVLPMGVSASQLHACEEAPSRL